MNKEFYIELIYKSLSGELTSGEQAQLEAWLKEADANQKEADAIRKLWSLSANFTKDIDVDLDQDFAQLQQKLQTKPSKSNHQGIVRKLPTPQKNTWWKPLSVAAAVLLLAGVFFFLNKNEAEVPLLTIETGDQEVREIALADGSKVWLNENSKFIYPEKMDDVIRGVTLSGEAFFDVAKNPKQPFVISTSNAEVKVLGTSFEVRAVDGESQTEVVVKTGKVSLGEKNTIKPLILTANQIGFYHHETRKYSRGEVKNLNTISWQSKVLDFNDVPLGKVLEDVENHFDIELTLTNEDLSKCPYGSIFSAPKQQEILEAICQVFDLKLVKVGDDNFRLEGGKCPNLGG